MLITGAGSPVGLALVDVARHAGATVYVLLHSENEGKIKQMGVEEVAGTPCLKMKNGGQSGVAEWISLLIQ